jgi:hypothetical protein
MIDPKTYEKALRAARNVARTSTRAAVGLGMLTTTGGCLSDTGGVGELSEDAVQDTLLSDGLGDVVAEIVDAVMADIFDAALPDTVVVDMVTPPDALVVDMVTPPDALVVDMVTPPDGELVDMVTPPDALVVDMVTPPDGELVDMVTPPDATEDVLAEVIAGDADVSTDVAASCNCLMPTELACTGWQEYGGECKADEDCDSNSWDGSDMKCGEAGTCQIATCDYEDAFDLVCQGDVCHQPEGWGPCCDAAYESEACMMGGAIPGCTPWGPPAPSAYDGLTLADFGLC